MRYIVSLLVLFGCAGYVEPDIAPRYAREAERCLRLGPCTVLQIDNANFYDAVIYLNGRRIGEAPGLKKSPPFFIPNSQLREGGFCATITVRLIGPGKVWQSGKECIQRGGGHFGLSIGNLFSTTTLTPWVAGQ